jgi:molybdenum cofactor synthesis domain-containing protein
MLTVEILCIGNELLSGITINTNSQWISQKIAETGGSVNRITVVGDDIDEISLAVKECLSRKPSWLIISGGLGPTYDDKTLEGVSVGLGVRLAVDSTAVEMLKKSYARRSIKYELNEIRLKMAKIPIGSIPIQNPVGSAPSVIIDAADKVTKVVCLPGVPKELKAIFSQSVLPQIKKIAGDFYIMLAPILSNVVESYPQELIYLKTHPQGYTKENEPRMNLQIVSKGKDKSEVEIRYDAISSKLFDEIKRLGGKIYKSPLDNDIS